MSTTPSKASKKNESSDLSNELNYEQAVAELEKLIQEMESGKMPLEENLASYKRGIELMKLCQKLLDQVEQQVNIFEEE